MDQFVDKVYEDMDDITKLIEPFECQLNNDLAQFPDEIELKGDDLMFILAHGSSWSNSYYASIDTIVRRKAISLGLSALQTEIANYSGFCRKYFDLEAVVCANDIMTFDPVTETLNGGVIFLKKKTIGLEDKDIEKKLQNMVYGLKYEFSFAAELNKSRFNEVASMFGAKEAKSERGWAKKLQKLIVHYNKMLEEKRLPIKDVDLFKRFISWNVAYIKRGSLPAMANLARLKIMLRSGAPIYSMVEDQV